MSAKEVDKQNTHIKETDERLGQVLRQLQFNWNDYIVQVSDIRRKHFHVNNLYDISKIIPVQTIALSSKEIGIYSKIETLVGVLNGFNVDHLILLLN